MKNKFLLIIGTVLLAMSVLGCNTLSGAGKDVESAGKSIQTTVEHNN
ncbi:MAG: entericidin A/B family lipoprotein [Candidatus Omnitrophota bacterium]|nr:entericidin A/B family lipoprotein [Candidatus Omnitrophota bacterium]